MKITSVSNISKFEDTSFGLDKNGQKTKTIKKKAKPEKKETFENILTKKIKSLY